MKENYNKNPKGLPRDVWAIILLKTLRMNSARRGELSTWQIQFLSNHLISKFFHGVMSRKLVFFNLMNRLHPRYQVQTSLDCDTTQFNSEDDPKLLNNLFGLKRIECEFGNFFPGFSGLDINDLASLMAKMNSLNEAATNAILPYAIATACH